MKKTVVVSGQFKTVFVKQRNREREETPCGVAYRGKYRSLPSLSSF